MGANMREKQFEKKVEKYLHSIGVYQAGCPSDKMKVEQVGWFTKIWGGGYQKSGIPDLLLCVNGIFISVELKAPNGRASELQKKNTAMINRSNGIGIILKPDGFEQFKSIVEGVIKWDMNQTQVLKNLFNTKGCQILQDY